MKTVTALLAAPALLVALGSCTLFGTGDPLIDTPTDAQLESFSKVFMSSYWAERGGAPSGDVARAVTPFLPRSAESGAARATVPVDRLTESVLFSDLQPKTFPNYPEPGQTTSFTITEVVAVDPKVYRIDVNTTYPSSDLRASYLESYYIKDTDSNGTWTIADEIVDDTWTPSWKYRLAMRLIFKDGTTRDETIVSVSTPGADGDGPKFSPAAFDIDGSLELSQAFVPATLLPSDSLIDASGSNGEVMYSSVVMYYVTPATNPSYWFWGGSVKQTILGVRFYTEVADDAADTYTSYTASFEKTFSILTTENGAFVEDPANFELAAEDVYVGATWDSLAESVLRQKVVYGLAGTATTGDYYKPSGTGAISSRMQTRVVNAAGLRDFILDQMNDEALALSLAESTFFVPDANAEEILAEDTGASVFLRTQQIDPAEGTVPFAIDGTTLSGLSEPLSTVYTAITLGLVGETVTGASAPVSNLFPTSNIVAEYDGVLTVGTKLDPAPAVTNTMGTRGTVEAWVYIAAYTSDAGIVHKGVLADFSDECFSLQGWGSKGQVAIVLDHPGAGVTTFDRVASTFNLKKATWYHLVATWDTDPTTGSPFARLFINGALNRAITPSVAAYRENDSAVIIGSQLADETFNKVKGYFGLDGKIAGVNAYAEAKDAAWVLAAYDAGKGKTVDW